VVWALWRQGVSWSPHHHGSCADQGTCAMPVVPDF